MLGFFSDKRETRYGAIMDIGSGTVSAAIVASKKEEKNFDVLWSHQEKSLDLKNTEQGTNIESLIGFCFDKLGTDGVKELGKKTSGKGKLGSFLVTISTPYSQTVAKKVICKKDAEFVVTEDLISGLEDKASKTAADIIEENKVASELEFVPIANQTTSIKLNDYVISDPFDKRTNNLEFIHITGMGAKKVIGAVKTGHRKNLPGTRLFLQPFMTGFYESMMSLKPLSEDMMLVNVTANTTEIALVENGSLDEVFFIPQGEYSIARLIQKLCSSSLGESVGYMKDNYISCNLSQEKQTTVEEGKKLYENAVSEALDKIRAGKPIPSTCYLHTNNQTDTFFAKRLEMALGSNSDLRVYPVSASFFTKIQENSNLALTSYVFHKNLYSEKSFDR